MLDILLFKLEKHYIKFDVMRVIVFLFVTFISCSETFSQNIKILSQLPIDDNSAFATLKLDRNEYAVGLISNKGVVSNQKQIELFPKSFGVLGDNVVVLCVESKKFKTVGYKAIQVSKKNCRIIAEKDLYKKENSDMVETAILKDSKGNFCYALFRQTNLDGQVQYFGPSNSEIRYLESSSIRIVSLNNKMEVKDIKVETVASSTYFAGAVSDEMKNIYICSFTYESMTMEKFDSTGKLLSKISTPISVREKKPYFNCEIRSESDGQQSIIVAANYYNASKKVVFNTVKFDFNYNRATTTGEEILSKDYCKSLKNVNEEASGKNFAHIDILKPVQILEDTNRILIVKEIKWDEPGGQKEPTTYYWEGSIITVHNKKTLEIERNIIIDKRLVTFVNSNFGTYARLSNNDLWVITCENSGLGSFKTFVRRINLLTGEIIKEEVEKEDIGRSWITIPEHVLWFKNNFVVPFFKVVSTAFSLDLETSFVIRKY